jgi:hypothetical protein
MHCSAAAGVGGVVELDDDLDPAANDPAIRHGSYAASRRERAAALDQSSPLRLPQPRPLARDPPVPGRAGRDRASPSACQIACAGAGGSDGATDRSVRQADRARRSGGRSRHARHRARPMRPAPRRAAQRRCREGLRALSPPNYRTSSTPSRKRTNPSQRSSA